MKKFSIITIIIGAFLIISGIVTPWISLLLMPPTPSVGIIGGADGPTLNYLYRDAWLSSIFFPTTLFGVAALICGLVSLVFKKIISEICTIKSSVIALILSALCGVAFYCVIVYIFETSVISIVCCLLALVGCCILCVSYIKDYIIDKKYKRIIFDAVIIIIYFVPFLMLFSYLHNVLSDIFRLIF